VISQQYELNCVCRIISLLLTFAYHRVIIRNCSFHFVSLLVLLRVTSCDCIHFGRVWLECFP